MAHGLIKPRDRIPQPVAPAARKAADPQEIPEQRREIPTATIKFNEALVRCSKGDKFLSRSVPAPTPPSIGLGQPLAHNHGATPVETIAFA